MFGFEGAGKASKKIPVAMRLWETPVPIPNTTVKTQTADDTWLETARESKWLPGYKKEFDIWRTDVKIVERTKI